MSTAAVAFAVFFRKGALKDSLWNLALCDVTMAVLTSLFPSLTLCLLQTRSRSVLVFSTLLRDFLFYFESQPCVSLPGLFPALTVVPWSFNFVLCSEKNFEL